MDKSKILVVDDRPENLVAMTVTLKKLDDVEVITVGSGQEALVATLNHEFSLLILDVQMPEMDGYELANFLRQEERTKNIPIIFMSAVHSENYHRYNNKNTGAVDFLTKPYNPHTLIYKTEFLISLQRQKKMLEEANEKLSLEHKELLAAQAKLVEAAKLASLGTLTSGIAHELNQPLTVIMFSATEVGDCLEDGEYAEIPEILERIRNNVKRASAITQHMLFFGSEMALELADWVEVNQIINDSLTIFETQFSNVGIKVELDIEPELPIVTWKQRQIEQVLSNLYSNSRYAMLDVEVKNLKIAVRLDNDQIRIEVHDTGHGITADIMPKIFDPFFTTKPVGSGQGLGLSACYGIIKQHGGEITATSTVGVGSVFTIILPIKSDVPDKEMLEEQA